MILGTFSIFVTDGTRCVTDGTPIFGYLTICVIMHEINELYNLSYLVIGYHNHKV